MFNKLRLQLVLINVAVMASIFFILILGTYFMVRHELAERSLDITAKIASDLQGGLIHDLPKREGHRPEISFVKLDGQEQIQFKSAWQPFDTEQLDLLIKQALAIDQEKGQIFVGHEEFFFLKEARADQPGTLLVFHEVEHEMAILRILLGVLVIIGLVSLGLSFLGSFILANRAMKPIQKSWQQQKEFLSYASHELRTPLAVIQTNLEVILSSPQEPVEKQMKWLQNINEEVASTAQLVDSLLFLARIDAKKQSLKKASFNFSQAALRVAENFRPLLGEKGLILQCDIEPELFWYGDEVKIRKLIGILLDNAIKATSAEGAINVLLRIAGDQIKLIIKDTGVGLTEAEIAKIFERFYQVDSARSSGGTGLGLAIAQWIVEEHGGQIAVKSQLEMGTEFTVYFPKAP